MRHGAARGRGPLLRRAADEGVRRRVGARPALRAQGRTSTPFRRPCSARSRGSSPRSSPSSARRRSHHRSTSGPSSRRPSRIGARRRQLARARGLASRHAGRGGAGLDRACLRTRAPRSSSRTEFVQLAELLAMRAARAFAKINLGSRRRTAPRRTASTRSSPSSSGSTCTTTIAIEPADAARRRGLRRGHDRPRRARVALAERPESSRAGASASRSGFPVAAGLGGGSSDAATALRSRTQRSTSRSLRRAPSHRGRVGADVPFFLRGGAQLATGDGTELAPLELPTDYWVVLVVPDRRGEGVDRRRLRAHSTSAAAPTASRREPTACARRSQPSRHLGISQSFPPNDLASSPLARELEPPARSARTSPAPARPCTGSSSQTAEADSRGGVAPTRGPTLVTRPLEAGRPATSGKMTLALGRGQVVRQRVLVP